jgi:hypothetical protein
LEEPILGTRGAFFTLDGDRPLAPTGCVRSSDPLGVPFGAEHGTVTKRYRLGAFTLGAAVMALTGP